ncbi:MAG TPA: carboxy-S-adenosyl-L-methionine synthase CmoA [Candidatus Omnitrophica bacterium]|nr:carboxy-S-adenosyl-L-methionine synthase CmoA [Candidatus Omnitrophota bacterium]
MKDKIYSKLRKKISKFVFDQKVANVFDDMISRSVPGYSDIVHMCGVLAAQFVKPRTRVYDLGCSLGAASRAVLNAVPDQAYELIALDPSAAMLSKAKKNLRGKYKASVLLDCGKAESAGIKNASFVMLNFVLQFISKANRRTLLKKIYAGLNSGGALVLSEKVDFETKAERETQRKLHEEFKKAQGYSDLEISQKRTALEKVLIPETLRVHEKRIRQAGFSKVYVWFRCFNFASIIAVK